MTNRPLNERTDAFYELPESVTADELTAYARYYRKHYLNYTHRKKNRFFFRFSSSIDRDVFLDTLETSARKTLVVERVVIYDY